MQMTLPSLKNSFVRIPLAAMRGTVLIFIQRSHPVIESWLLLAHFELVMKFRSSQALRHIVRAQHIRPMKCSSQTSSETLSHAMDLACVFYFKRVLCLQRSTATTVLLRRHGWRAELVTGAQILPPEFHAWVEIDGIVVNDKAYMREIYQVLERC
jgi:hypothetical protein